MASSAFPVCTFGVFALTCICHIVDLKYKIPCRLVNFSGQHLKEHKYYVLITQCFFHGSNSHLFQELTLLLPLAICIELNRGSIFFFCVYFLFGTIASILTWICDRIYFASLYPDGIFLADCIWSRGASGNVYGMVCLTAVLYGQKEVFGDISLQSFGLLWCLTTNILFRLLDKRSYFYHYPKITYPVLLSIVSAVVFCVKCPQTSINHYLIIYFLYMCIWRRFPFLVIVQQENFVATDFKCHLFAALSGVCVGLIVMVVSVTDAEEAQPPYSWQNFMPFALVLLSEGYFGQLRVWQRIRQNIKDKEERRNGNKHEKQSSKVN